MPNASFKLNDTEIFSELNQTVTAKNINVAANDTTTPSMCKAWVNFNGNTTGTAVGLESHFTVASNGIRGAYNVDYVIDRGVGDYKVHFENALPDANYCICLSAGSHSASSPPAYFGPSVSSIQAQGYSYGTWATHDQVEIENTHFSFQTAYPINSTIYDNQVICVSIFR